MVVMWVSISSIIIGKQPLKLLILSELYIQYICKMYCRYFIRYRTILCISDRAIQSDPIEVSDPFPSAKSKSGRKCWLDRNYNFVATDKTVSIQFEYQRVVLAQSTFPFALSNSISQAIRSTYTEEKWFDGNDWLVALLPIIFYDCESSQLINIQYITSHHYLQLFHHH